MAEGVKNTDLQQPSENAEQNNQQSTINDGGNREEQSLIEDEGDDLEQKKGEQLSSTSAVDDTATNNLHSLVENTEENTDDTVEQQPSMDSVKSIPRIAVSFEDGELHETSMEELNQQVTSEAATNLTPVPGELDIIKDHKGEEGKPIEEEMSADEFQSVSSDSVEEFDRNEALENYKVLSSEYEKNLTTHNHLQHKISEYLAKKKADEKPDPGKNVTDQEQRFQKCMAALNQLQMEAQMDKEYFESEEKSLINHCKVKQEEMEQAWKVFKEMVIEKCVAAVHSRTGRKLTSHEIEQYLGMLEKKDEEVIQVRLENLKLQSRINKLDELIQQKEQLAEGLHMIDFEQLRINNVDLNEKIEDRNEEIHKLQKKVTSTVQVLAHLKEKLQFMQTQNHLKEGRLSDLDQDVAKNRDILNRLKHAKDAVRSENIHLKERGGLVFHRALLRDFEEQIDLKESMLTKLRDIKEKHADLTLLCNKLKQKIDQAKAIML